MTVRATRLRGRGLERPGRAQGVSTSGQTLRDIVTLAELPHEVTPAGKLWVIAWGVALLAATQGWKVPRVVRVQVVRWFAARVELRDALETLWRLGQFDALREQARRAWETHEPAAAPAPPHPRLPGA